MKLSKTGIKELTARYRSVLLKCFAIAMAVSVSSGAMAAGTTVVIDDSVVSGTGDQTVYTKDGTDTAITEALADYAKSADVYTKTETMNNSQITGAISTAITNATSTLDSSVNTGASSKLAITVSEVDGKLTEVTGSINAGAVGTTELAADAVTNAKLADDAVQTENIVNGAVTTDKLGADAVTNAKLADDAVQTENIVNGAVTKDKLADAVKNNLLDNATTGNGLKITDGDASTAAKVELVLADDAGTKMSGLKLGDDGLAISTGDSLKVDSTSGKLDIKYDTTTFETTTTDGLKIRSGAITSEMIKDGTIGFADLNGDSVATAIDTSTNKVATSNAVKTYVDGEIDKAIVNNASSKTVTLTGNGSAQTVYDTTGTADYVKSNAESATYSGTTVTGATASGTLKGALSETTAQVNTNTAKIGTTTDGTNVSSANTIGQNLNALDTALVATDTKVGAAQTATATTGLLNGKSIGTSTSVIAALDTVAQTAAGTALDNKFTGTNTFGEQIIAEKGVKFGDNTSTFTIDNTGAAKLASVEAAGGFTVDSDNKLTSAGLTAEEVKTGKITMGTNFVTAIDNGASALSAGDANTLATTQTVMQSAQNGTYTNTVNATLTNIKTGTTIASALKDLDVTIGDIDQDGVPAGTTISDKLVNVQGELNTTQTSVGTLATLINGQTMATDGTLSGTAVAMSGVKDKIGNTVTTLTGAANLIGDLNSTGINAETLAGQIGKVATTTNGVAAMNTVAANIDALNNKVGDVSAVSVNGYTAGTGTVVGSVNKLNSNMTNVLGDVYGTDGSYAGSALTSAMYESKVGASMQDATSLTGSLNNFADNVAKVTGSAINATTGAVENNYTVSSVDYAALDSATSLAQGIGQVSKNIGTADVLGTDEKNGVKQGNTVNQNIAAINAVVGNVGGLTEYTTGGHKGNAMADHTDPDNPQSPTTLVEAVNNIDATLGMIHGLKGYSDLGDASNLAEGTTVEDHLVSLDNAIGDRNYTSTNYIKSGATVSDSLSTLDAALKDVDTRVSRLNRRMTGGFASLAAMSALQPNARAEGNTQISAGTGTYRGRVGMAVGAFHYLNDEVMMNLGASYAGSTSATFRAGVTFGL